MEKIYFELTSHFTYVLIYSDDANRFLDVFPVRIDTYSIFKIMGKVRFQFLFLNYCLNVTTNHF